MSNSLQTQRGINMPKLKSRMMFDVVLTVMLVFEMFYQLTGNLLHEIVGAAFFICIVVHLLFSSRWIKDTAKSIGKNKMNRRRKSLTIVAMLLFVDVLALAFSSIVISNTLWTAGIDLSALNPNGIWYPIHTASAYGLCALTLGHLAMHWVSMAHVMRIEYNPERRQAIGQCVNVAVGLGALALGVAGAQQVGQALPLDLLDGDSTNTVESSSTASASSSTAPMSTRDTMDSLATTNAPAANESESLPLDRTQTKSSKQGKSASRSSSTREQQSNDVALSNDASSTQSETTAERTEEQSPAYETTSESGTSESSSSQNLGTCTLCPKHCSLSSPRCNKPYAAGLIS